MNDRHAGARPTRRRALGLLGALLVPSAAVRAAEATSSSPSPLPPEARAEIYRQVVERLAGPDDTFAGRLRPATVYLSRALAPACVFEPPSRAASAPPHCDRQRQATRMDADLESRLMAGLAGVEGRRIVFVDNERKVPRSGRERAVGHRGAIVTLGQLVREGEDELLVGGDVYVAAMASGKTRYRFKRADGEWRLDQVIPGLVA